MTPNGILLLCIEGFGVLKRDNLITSLKKLDKGRKILYFGILAFIAAVTTGALQFTLLAMLKPNEPVNGTICLFCAFFCLVSLCSCLSLFSASFSCSVT